MDTLERSRNLSEFSRFLTEKETQSLHEQYPAGLFNAWGAVPGENNPRTWEQMSPGDYVLVYRDKAIVFVAEVAHTLHNRDLAEYFWKKDADGQTWEYMFLLVNPTPLKVTIKQFNELFDYKDNYFPRGFHAIQEEKANLIFTQYGDLLSVLKQIEDGHELLKSTPAARSEDEFEMQEERKVTEHDEMQSRLIQMGMSQKLQIWIPKNDQSKSYKGFVFKDHVLAEFPNSIDIPESIPNIDTVWKVGKQIIAAFEIEHSTEVYSGILRMCDLALEAPNSSYPLFIVSDKKRLKVFFKHISRPSFNNRHFTIADRVGFLTYDNIRELEHYPFHQDAEELAKKLKNLAIYLPKEKIFQVRKADVD